jgi:hypothetical protein
MTAPEIVDRRHTVGWRRSSHSGTDGNCVEISRPAHRVVVRDSKAAAAELAFPTDHWQAFLAATT